MSSLQQTLEISLVDVQPVQIHQSPYYDITYREAGSDAVHQMRINPEAFYTDPQPGDRVAVTVVMGTIMGAAKLN
jgi:hypothetical protein